MATIANLGVDPAGSAAEPRPSRVLGERAMEIRRLGQEIGVEVTAIDVRTLDEEGFAPIYRAWLDCNVMVVRD
jgi:hypothetical protein